MKEQISARVNQDIVNQLRRRARAENRSFSNMINKVCTDWILENDREFKEKYGKFFGIKEDQ